MKQIALTMALLGMQVTLQQSYGTSCTFPVVSIELTQRSGTYDNIEDFFDHSKGSEDCHRNILDGSPFNGAIKELNWFRLNIL